MATMQPYHSLCVLSTIFLLILFHCPLSINGQININENNLKELLDKVNKSFQNATGTTDLLGKMNETFRNLTGSTNFLEKMNETFQNTTGSKDLLEKVNETFKNMTGGVDLFQTNSDSETSPSLLHRIRQHMRNKVNYIRSRIYKRREQVVNGIAGLFDQLKERIQLQKERSGDDTTRDTWEGIKEMIESLQSMIRHLLLRDSGQASSSQSNTYLADLDNINNLKERIEQLQRRALIQKNSTLDT